MKKENFSHFYPYPEGEGKKNVEIRVNNLSKKPTSEGTQEAVDMFLNAKEYNREDIIGSELEKNDEELKMIKIAQDGINDFLLEYGLTSINFDINNIHIFSDYIYEKKIGKTRGIFKHGHVYMRRSDEEFLKTLVHELIHKTSFYRVDVDIEDEGLYFENTRTGLGMARGDNKKFVGINEAITERIASDVLERIAEQNNYSEKDKEELLGTMSYIPQVTFLMELINKISKERGIESNQIFREIVQGMYFGKYTYLKEFEKKHKGISKILANIGLDKEDLIEASKKIGMDKSFIDWLKQYGKGEENEVNLSKETREKYKPDISFSIDKDVDLDIFMDFLSEGRAIHPDLKHLEDMDDIEKCHSIAKKFFDKYYKDYKEDIEKGLKRAEEDWRKVEIGFYEKVDELFDAYPWPEGEYSSTASILKTYPRFIDKKFFTFPADRPDVSNLIIAHEMLHFITYDYLEKKYALKPSERYDKDNTFWQFTENLNVLLENDPGWQSVFGNREGRKSAPYSECEEMFKNMKKIWDDNKNLDNLIQKFLIKK